MRPSVDQRLGKYRLIAPLGSGANADVWRATDDDTEVALKILRTKNPVSEPYRRFQREVRTQLELTAEGFAGLLPVLDVSVPQHPTPLDPAWFAMPVAESLGEALGASPLLADVVEAIAQAADVLSRLDERGIHHRDVKPANLFSHGGRVVIGDLGLIELPEAAPLTSGAKGLGPRYYIAPEMLLWPDTAAGGPADVYSLAKTLWVLGSGQRVPFPGEMRRDVKVVRLSTYVAHPRASVLDSLIERACRADPEARPTMRAVAEELRAWAREPATVAAGDLSHLRDMAAAAMERTVADHRAFERRTREAKALFEVQVRGLRKVDQMFGQIGVHGLATRSAEPSLLVFTRTWWPLENEEFGELVANKYGRQTYVMAGGLPNFDPTLVSDPPGTVYLWAAVTLRVDRAGAAVLGACYALGERVKTAQILWRDSRRAALGSAMADDVVAELEAELVAQAEAALTKLMTRINA